MWKRFLVFFKAPVFSGDEQRTRHAEILHYISFLPFVFTLLLLILNNLLSNQNFRFNLNLLLAIFAFLFFLLQWLVRSGYVDQAGALLFALAWIMMTWVSLKWGSIRFTTVMVYILIVLGSAIVQGWRFSVMYTVASIAAIWWLAFMETSGAITPIVMEPYELAFNLTLYFPLILLIVYYLIRTITNALATSQRELTERLRIESEHEKLIVQLSEEVAERKRAQDELQQMAMTDPLTGMFNRRHFFAMAEVEFAKTTRYARPLSIVIFDIDLFKGINDTYGHPAGDQVLIQISDVLRTKVRRTDFSARYGGEEFIVLLTETGISGAQSFAEHLRRLVEEMPVQYGGNSISVTASFGVASREQLEHNQTLDHLIFLADQALYEAKKTGRNRVVCHHTEG